MEVYLNRLDGWDDAIISMFLSKRTLTRELEMEIRKAVYESTLHNPEYGPIGSLVESDDRSKVENWIDKFIKWGQKAYHYGTLPRFFLYSLQSPPRRTG